MICFINANVFDNNINHWILDHEDPCSIKYVDENYLLRMDDVIVEKHFTTRITFLFDTIFNSHVTAIMRKPHAIYNHVVIGLDPHNTFTKKSKLLVVLRDERIFQRG